MAVTCQRDAASVENERLPIPSLALRRRAGQRRHITDGVCAFRIGRGARDNILDFKTRAEKFYAAPHGTYMPGALALGAGGRAL